MTRYFKSCRNGIIYESDDPHCVGCHPVVVIDPEDRERVLRLGELIRKHTPDPIINLNVTAALSEFAANPTPPTPPEPNGDAVVRDVDGDLWEPRVGESGLWRVVKPGPLGQSKAVNSLAEVERLRKALADCRAEFTRMENAWRGEVEKRVKHERAETLREVERAIRQSADADLGPHANVTIGKKYAADVVRSLREGGED